ncbi:methyltransferase domain-containing protein [Candidatus Xenohaliotis californiensis]
MTSTISSNQNNKSQSFIKKKFKVFWHKILNLHETNMEVGLCHYYMDNNFDATIRFKLILKFYPNDIEAQYNLGRCYMKKNKFHEAFRIFEELANRHSMAKYQWEKSINSFNIKTIPSTIINEAAHHITTYRIYHDKKDMALHSIVLNALSNHQDTEKKLNILHICCGIGEIGTFLKKASIECDIFGIDTAPIATEHCEKLWFHKTGKVYKKTQTRSTTKLLDPMESLYNAVFCTERISYHANLEKILKKFKQFLHQNGIIVIALFNTENNDVEFNEIHDYFQFSQEYVKSTAEKISLEVLDIYNSKGNFSTANNNSSLYIMQLKN